MITITATKTIKRTAVRVPPFEFELLSLVQGQNKSPQILRADILSVKTQPNSKVPLRVFQIYCNINLQKVKTTCNLLNRVSSEK